MLDHDIFSSLSKYKTEESYFTKALVYVLQLLRDSNPKTCCGILNKLCFDNNSVFFEDNEHIDITTEQTSEESRPDIEVCSSNRFVYIEVKVHSAVDKDQLEKHEKGLAKFTQKGYKTNLVLLTVPNTPGQETKPERIKSVTSDDIYDWLAGAENNTQEHVRFLITQYRSFLERFKKVDLNDVETVIQTIDSAGKELGFIMTRADSEGWGFYLRHPDYDSKLGSQFWCGIYQIYPRELCFSIDLTKCSYGLPRKTRGGGQYYERESLPLDTAFFSLGGPKQLQGVKDYINREYCFAKEHKGMTLPPATRKPKYDLSDQPVRAIDGNQKLITKCKDGEYQLWQSLKTGKFGVQRIVNNKYNTIEPCRCEGKYAREIFNKLCSDP